MRAALLGYRDRLIGAQRSALVQAWHQAALARMVPMPSLSDLLDDPAEPQSEDEMLLNMRALAAASKHQS